MGRYFGSQKREVYMSEGTATLSDGVFKLADLPGSGWTAEELEARLVRLGCSGPGDRAFGVELELWSSDFSNDQERSCVLWLIDRWDDSTDHYRFLKLGDLTVTYGQLTGPSSGAVIGSSHRAVDTMVWVDSAYAQAVAAAEGLAVQAHSPAGDDLATLIVPGALRHWGLLVEDTGSTVLSNKHEVLARVFS